MEIIIAWVLSQKAERKYAEDLTHIVFHSTHSIVGTDFSWLDEIALQNIFILQRNRTIGFYRFVSIAWNDF